MKIHCTHCGARYDLEEPLLEESCFKVACSACHKVFEATQEAGGDEPGQQGVEDEEMEQLLAEMEETLAGLEKLDLDRPGRREPLPAALENDVPAEMSELKATEVPPELLLEPGPEQRRGHPFLGGLMVLLLGLLLAAQIAWLQRDRWLQQPQLRALAARWCPYLGCTLPPAKAPRPTFEVTDGQLQNAAPQRYRLRLLLRNLDGDGQSLPALQVSLTDDQQRLVARRTFDAPVYAAGHGPTLNAGEALQLELLLAVPSERVAGYEVRIIPGGT
jgi:hypothetical protein